MSISKPGNRSHPGRGRGRDAELAAVSLALVLKVEARGRSGVERRALERRADEAIDELVETMRRRIVGELLGELDGRIGASANGRDAAGEWNGRGIGRATPRTAMKAQPAPIARAAGPRATKARSTEGDREASVAVEGAEAEPTAGGASDAPAAGQEPAPAPVVAADGAAGSTTGKAGQRPAIGFYKARGEIFVVGQSSVWCVQSPKLVDRKPARRGALPAGARPCGPPAFAYVPRFCWE